MQFKQFFAARLFFDFPEEIYELLVFKDDPVLVCRCQGDFPAVGETLEPHRLPMEEMEYTTMPQVIKRLEERWKPLP